MSKLSEKDVLNITRLARIRMTDEQQKHYAQELTTILGWVERLAEVNTDGVEPMTSVEAMALILREDEVSSDILAEEVFKNAPKTHLNCFVVPKVLENE